MTYYSRIELSGPQAGLIARVQSAKIEALMRNHEIAERHLENALDRIGELSVSALTTNSPIGKDNPGTLDSGGHTPPRRAGTLASSWSHRVSRVGPDGMMLVVGSSDPVSEYVDKGTGIYKTGPGTRSKIYPSEGAVLGAPASHLRIGGSRAKRGGKKVVLDIRWFKSIKGQPAQHIVTRSQMQVRPVVGPILRDAARQAKRDLVRALKT